MPYGRKHKASKPWMNVRFSSPGCLQEKVVTHVATVVSALTSGHFSSISINTLVAAFVLTHNTPTAVPNYLPIVFVHIGWMWLHCVFTSPRDF